MFNKKFNLALIVILMLICYNILLTVILTQKIYRLSILESENSKLNSIINLQDYFVKKNYNYFQISQQDILENIGRSKIKSLKDSLYYVIIIPNNACQSCIASLFAEIKSSTSDVSNFYAILESNEIVLVKQWISYGFLESNYIIDKRNILRSGIIDHDIVIFKISRDNERFDFIWYEAGFNKYLRDFLNLSNNS